MRKRVVLTCEMCSAEVTNPVTIKVEGAILSVCQKCSSFGNVVIDPKKQTAKKTNTVIKRKSDPVASAKQILKARSNSKQKNIEKELISDYGEVIKEARMKKKLNQEHLASLTGISVASLKAFETEKMRPTDLDAKKLERELEIELIVAPETDLEYQQNSKAKGTTVGDIVVIKRYDYEND